MKMQLRKNITLSPQAKGMLNLMGIQGFFWFAWAFANYQTVYLQNIGMTSSDIGVLNAVCSVVGIFASAIWGMISDKINSIKKTGKLMIVHEDTYTGGWGAQLASYIAEHAITDLDAPIVRVATPDIPIPFCPTLESAVIPSAARIAEEARKLAKL